MFYLRYNGCFNKSQINGVCLFSSKGTQRLAKALTTRVNGHSENKKESGPKSYESSRRGSFFQVEPELGNQFKRDVFLSTYLKRNLPTEVSTFGIKYHWTLLKPPVNHFFQTALLVCINNTSANAYPFRFSKISKRIWKGLAKEWRMMYMKWEEMLNCTPLSFDILMHGVGGSIVSLQVKDGENCMVYQLKRG